MAAVTPDAVQAVVTVPDRRDILQVPPMVSAIRVGGKRLHALAREGIEVEREPRPVVVYRFEVDPDATEVGVYRFVVDCSSGTYVRSLVADLGHALGGGAHMRSLRRVAIGSFVIEEARPLDDLVVLPAREALRDYPSVTVDESVARDIGFGKVLPGERLGVEGDGPWAVVDGDGELLAVYERHRDATVKPAVVLAPAEPRSSSDETDG